VTSLVSPPQKYQDNNLPFKPTETGEGEVMGPVCPSLYLFARFVHPVTERLPIVLFNRTV